MAKRDKSKPGEDTTKSSVTRRAVLSTLGASLMASGIVKGSGSELNLELSPEGGEGEDLIIPGFDKTVWIPIDQPLSFRCDQRAGKPYLVANCPTGGHPTPTPDARKGAKK
jgi:hypothetical protein